MLESEKLENGKHRWLPSRHESRLNLGLHSHGRRDDHDGDRAVMGNPVTDAAQQELGNAVQAARADDDHLRTFARGDLDQDRSDRSALLEAGTVTAAPLT